MSGGWQVGDLAVAVMSNDGEWVDDDGYATDEGPEPNGVYRVAAIELEACEYQLAFEEFDNEWFFPASCFRKIKPDTEPCEEEFTVLIKRGRKVGVDA